MPTLVAEDCGTVKLNVFCANDNDPELDSIALVSMDSDIDTWFVDGVWLPPHPRIKL